MSSLPTGWITAPLGAFTTDCGQRVPEESEEFKYIDIGSVNRETKRIETPQQLLGKNAPSRARKHVKAGDVLVSMTRPNLNAVALVPEELDGQIASTGFDVLRASSGIEPRWVSYLVRTAAFVDAMSELVQGALYPAVRPKDIRGFETPLAPLPEQKRIADKLDAVLARVDACRDHLDRIPAILKRFRQSVLAAATSGKLTEDWRANQVARMEPQAESGNIARDSAQSHYVVTAAPDSATLHPGYEAESTNGNEWRQVQLSEVTRNLSYGTSAKSSKSGAVPVLRMGNIQDGRLDWNNLVYTSDLKEIAKYRLASGDVLFNRTNSPELVGKAAVFKGEREAVYAGYLIRVRCLPQLLPDYLNYCLGSPAGRDYCWQVKSDGVSQSNINAKKLAAFSFLLPSAQEQTEIVRRVEALFAYANRLEARHAAARTQVEKLTPSTLAKAFRGELVPQDPNDEPASVLLERIHAQRNELRTSKPSRSSREQG